MRGAEKTKENRSEELNGIKDQMMRLEQKQKIFSMCKQKPKGDANNGNRLLIT